MKKTRLGACVAVSLLLWGLNLQAQQSDSADSTSGTAVPPASTPSEASAGTVPRLVHFSGVVKPAGSGKAAAVSLTFSLYQEQEGGNPLWVETQNVQVDEQGHYTVLLGTTQPDGLPLDLFTTGQARWLGVQPELPGAGEQPRVLLVGVPYALKAADADTLGGLPASAFMQTGQSAGSDGSVGTPSPRPTGGAPRGGPSDSAGQAQPAKGKSAQPNTAIANYLPYWNGTASVGNSAVYQSGGNVGVGTTTPRAGLDVFASTAGAHDPVAQFGSGGTGDSNSVKVYNGGGNATLFVSGGPSNFMPGTSVNDGGIRILAGQKIFFGDSGLTRMVLDKSGNAGIGTTTPATRLDVLATTAGVHDPLARFGSAGTTDANSLEVYNGGGEASLFVAGQSGQFMPGTSADDGGLRINEGQKIFLGDGGLSRMVLDKSGNVGIGTTTPAAKLEVNGTAKFDQAVTFPSGLSISNTGLITFAAGQTLPAVSGNEMVTGEITSTNSAGQAGSFTSTNEGSIGLTASGGGGSSGGTAGVGITASGGNESNITTGNGGVGLIANGGSAASSGNSAGNGGDGIQANGGVAGNGGLGGAGIVVMGGRGEFRGGDGLDATGGIGVGIGVVGNGGGWYQGFQAGGVGVIGMGGTGGPDSFGDGSGVVANGGSSLNGEPAGDGIDAYPGTGGSGSPYAGSFNGNVNVSGILTSTVKDFRIDHPLDPANKYLYHSSVESSEMMNMYTGNATLDASGEATVQLPAWFQTENADFRYQLTAIGAPAPGLYVAQEIQNSSFGIAGGQAGMKVSWQVTAVRQDAYAKAHPLAVEVDKPANERGYFIHPELYGAPAEKSIDWARHPELMKLIKEKREKQDKEAQAMRAQLASHAKP